MNAECRVALVPERDTFSTGVAMKRDALNYHSQRATRELDLGLLAHSPPAQRAHLQLASMHLQRVRELSGRRGTPIAIVD